MLPGRPPWPVIPGPATAHALNEFDGTSREACDAFLTSLVGVAPDDALAQARAHGHLHPDARAKALCQEAPSMLDLDACAGKPPQAAPNPVHKDVDLGSAAAEQLLLDACGVWRSRARRPTRQAGRPTVSPIRGVQTRPGVPGHARLTQKAYSGLTPPFHRKKLSPEVRLSNSTGKRCATGRFAACSGATPFGDRSDAGR